MSEESRLHEQAKILASVGSHRSRRFVTPLQVAEDMQSNRSKYPTKKALAEAYNFRDASMVDRFLSLLKLPNEISSKVTFQGSGTNLGLDKAFRISKLKSQDDMIYMGREILRSDLTTAEVRQILQLKNKNEDIPIEECVKLVRDYRVVVEETNVIVVTLRPTTRESLHLNGERKQGLLEALKIQLKSSISDPNGLRHLSETGGRMVLVLSSKGYEELTRSIDAQQKSISEFLSDLIDIQSRGNE